MPIHDRYTHTGGQAAAALQWAGDTRPVHEFLTEHFTDPGRFRLAVTLAAGRQGPIQSRLIVKVGGQELRVDTGYWLVVDLDPPRGERILAVLTPDGFARNFTEVTG